MISDLASYGSAEDCLRSLSDSRLTLLTAMESVDDESLYRRAGDDVWSLAMIADHVARSEASGARVIRMLRRVADSAHVRRDAAEVGRRRPDGRAIAPTMTEPDPHATREEVLMSLESARRSLVDFVLSGDYPLERDVTYPHPFFGDLNALGWLCSMAYHERHHLEQFSRQRATPTHS